MFQAHSRLLASCATVKSCPPPAIATAVAMATGQDVQRLSHFAAQVSLIGHFPCSKKSHLQNEAKCETFVVKMSFICMRMKNHFHINGFALSLALKVRLFGTRKWPIEELHVVERALVFS